MAHSALFLKENSTGGPSSIRRCNMSTSLPVITWNGTATAFCFTLDYNKSTITTSVSAMLASKVANVSVVVFSKLFLNQQRFTTLLFTFFFTLIVQLPVLLLICLPD